MAAVLSAVEVDFYSPEHKMLKVRASVSKVLPAKLNVEVFLAAEGLAEVEAEAVEV